LPNIAESKTAVLIVGESGTGKELFARAIHNISPCKDRSFVAVNCGALPDTLLESELFVYKAGAFTDVKKDKPGRFALLAETRWLTSCGYPHKLSPAGACVHNLVNMQIFNILSNNSKQKN
jgi:hypothetical protein